MDIDSETRDRRDGVRQVTGERKAADGEIGKEELVNLFRVMTRIRLFEERAKAEFAAGGVPGTLHLSIGQEAVAAGVCCQLETDDVITTTHRGHGHCLAKGMEPVSMVAELLGRSTGACGGKGGSMHIADVKRGVLGANGIVGAGLPLACGAGLVSVYRQTQTIAVAFFGDGAANIGAFNESLNLAAIWCLPVVFVAENNGYAEATPFEYHCAGGSIARRAEGYGFPGITVDGTDVIAVHSVAGEAIARARRGEGPTLIEATAARVAGHHEGDTQTYRNPSESETIKSQDPVDRLRDLLGSASTDRLGKIEREEEAILSEAWESARKDPLPPPESLTQDVYVSFEQDGHGNGASHE
jgi:pyruvate dehydrogenase E1 component alpha subunit